VEELLEQLQKSRARPDNISYFAFTGTPKHSTLMLFGRVPDPSRPAIQGQSARSLPRTRCARPLKKDSSWMC
jgi:type I restriction enzyme R subunit